LDPHLAAMLVIFARLTAGEAIDSREQAGALSDWARCGVARLGRVMAVTVACRRACVRWVLRRLRCAWITARWRLGRSVHNAVGFPPAAGKPDEPRRPS
jgi:hypothetical protein